MPETSEVIELFDPIPALVDISGLEVTIGDAGGVVVHAVPAGTVIPDVTRGD